METVVPPKVTVLMCVYNGAEWLPDSIESILNQRFSDFEFLIVDDGSQDESAAIVSTYLDKRIRLIRNQHNTGLTRSLNKGLSVARGEFIARMDADDISMPDRLAAQVQFLEAHPLIDVAGSLYESFDEATGVGSTPGLPETDLEIKQRLFWHNTMAHGSVMFRKNVILEAGGYDERFKTAQDFNLWFRLAAGGSKFHIIQRPLYRLRLHKKSISSNRRDDQKKSVQQTQSEGFETFKKQTAALILSHNKVDQTIECLRKVAEMGLDGFVLDNASSSTTVAYLTRFLKSRPSIQLFSSSENLGVSGGRNVLIKHALTKGYRNFLFLDNDLVPPDYSMEHFFRNAFFFPDADAFKPRLFNEHDACYAGFYEMKHVGNEYFRELSDRGVINVFSGGASLVRSRVFEQAGLYDEQMFVGYEDYEFAIRFEKMVGKPLEVRCIDSLTFLHRHIPPLFKEDYKTIAGRYDQGVNQDSIQYMEKKLNIRFKESAAGYTERQKQKFSAGLTTAHRAKRLFLFYDALYTSDFFRSVVRKLFR